MRVFGYEAPFGVGIWLLSCRLFPRQELTVGKMRRRRRPKRRLVQAIIGGWRVVETFVLTNGGSTPRHPVGLLAGVLLFVSIKRALVSARAASGPLSLHKKHYLGN